VTIGSLMEGGFRLIRERPGAMLIWTIIQLVVAIATSLAMTAILQGGVDSAMSGEPQQSVQLMIALQSLLVGMAGLVITAILYAAVQRAILRPDEGGPGWLRLGMDEVRYFLLILLCGVLFLVAALVVGLFLYAFLRGAGPAVATLATYIVIGLAGALLGTKVSLIFPLTLKRQAFAIGEGTALTRGRFWTLFATYFILFLIMLAISVANMAVTQPEYLSAIFQYGFGSYQEQQASTLQYQKLMSGTIDAQIIIGWVLTAVEGAVSCALFGGAAATAVQQLTSDQGELSETFS
jgi:hypothetical protein